MALPLIPIIMAVASLGAGIVNGISQVRNAKNEADSVRNQAIANANERAKQAKKLMQQQKSSFLKGGVYFDSGSPLEVINETYDTSMKDIDEIFKDSNRKVENLKRQGTTAFFGSLLEGIGNGAMGFLGAGGNASQLGKSISGSKVGTSFQNLWSKIQGTNKVSGGIVGDKVTFS